MRHIHNMRYVGQYLCTSCCAAFFQQQQEVYIPLRPGYGRIVYLTYREPCVQGETGGILHHLTVCILIPHHAVFANPASARLKLRLYEYDCMLQNGAKKVYAIDVGYGQLDWKLRNDPRVVVMERTNARK